MVLMLCDQLGRQVAVLMAVQWHFGLELRSGVKVRQLFTLCRARALASSSEGGRRALTMGLCQAYGPRSGRVGVW